VEYCPTNCLSVTEEYELATYDRHELNFDNVAMGRLPYKVTDDPMVTPIREFAYLPAGVIDGHDLPDSAQRPGQRPEELAKSMPKSESPKKPAKESAKA
jgi:NAD(P)H-quinone oxidoreductase subunit I